MVTIVFVGFCVSSLHLNLQLKICKDLNALLERLHVSVRKSQINLNMVIEDFGTDVAHYQTKDQFGIADVIRM